MVFVPAILPGQTPLVPLAKRPISADIIVLDQQLCKLTNSTNRGDSGQGANVVSLAPLITFPETANSGLLTGLEKAPVERSELEKLAHLARLNVADNVFDEVAQSITDVLALVDRLQSADTQGVEPMAHPQDALQRLRTDQVTEANHRDDFQAIAPQTESGLYLVPKVID